MQPTLYLFVGYPGAGKTTIARLITDRIGAVHLWADNIRSEMFDAPCHSAEESKILYDKLNAETAEWLQQGRSVVFDTNFNFYDDRQLLRQIAVDAGATTRLIWVTTGIELSRQRAVNESNGKDIRVYGDMTNEDFERIAGRLQPPRPDEQAYLIDGSDLAAATVYETLNI